MASVDTAKQGGSRGKFDDTVKQYYAQLTEGCGRKVCSNPNCATGRGKPFENNQAAAIALAIAQRKRTAYLCPAATVDSTGAPSSVSAPELSLRKSSATRNVPNSKSDSSWSAPNKQDAPSVASPQDSQPVEPMECGVEASQSTDSATSSTLILVHSNASTGLSPPLHGQPRQPSAGSVPTETSSSTTTTTTEDVTTSEEAMTSESSTTTTTTTTSSSSSSCNTGTGSSSALEESSDTVSMDVASPPPFTTPIQESQASPSEILPPLSAILPSLSEAKVLELVEEGKTALPNAGYKALATKLWMTFSNPLSLNKSFLLPEEEVGEGLSGVAKETGIMVDVASARRVYDLIYELDEDIVSNTLVNAIDMYQGFFHDEKSFISKHPLNHFVTLLENRHLPLPTPEFPPAYTKLLKLIASIPLEQKLTLVLWYSHYSVEDLQSFVSAFQQVITVQLVLSEENTHRRVYIPQSDSLIAAVTKVMTIFYFANLLKAKRNKQLKPLTPALASVAAKVKPDFMQVENSEFERFMMQLQVHPALAMSLPIPCDEFINEELNNRINMQVDYHREGGSGGDSSSFAFIEFPFILSPANKVEKVLRDNLYSMYSERQRTFFHSVLTGVIDIPYLLLRINRDNIVSDALVQLETIADLNPIDLRKQLRVEFEGEEGIDEGGLQKEFFQLIIEQLFDPQYGLFVFDEDSRQHLFNPATFEGEEQYQLIGLLLGLAIYNNIILDIRFPVVVYRKLIGCETVLDDLFSSHGQIAHSLRSMLEYEGSAEEFGSTFMATFQVSHTDPFDHVHTHCLKEGGDSIPVTPDNCQEYADLYADWLLNGSISTSFSAFKKGFDVVVRSSNLADLFTAEEVELLVCGSSEWDLGALKESTRYDGFSENHPVIRNFWETVEAFSVEQQKQLLAFVTGSDRIPLGGLAKVKFIIVKNGPDSDRLPTAHTCFNALLLCEYSSKEKLADRLTKAITHAKGFGMI